MVTRVKIGNTYTRIWSDAWIKTNHHHLLPGQTEQRGQCWFNIHTKEVRTLESYDAIGEHYKAIRLAQPRTIELPNSQRALMVKSEK